MAGTNGLFARGVGMQGTNGFFARGFGLTDPDDTASYSGETATFDPIRVGASFVRVGVDFVIKNVRSIVRRY